MRSACTKLGKYILPTIDISFRDGVCLQYTNLSISAWKFGCNFQYVILKLILVIDDVSTYCKIALTWMPQDLTDD